MSEERGVHEHPGVGPTRRIEALVDGVFAIVMTIIVIEIDIPEGPASQLLAQLGENVPTLLGYALVFITLGTVWFGNRTSADFARYADHAYVWLTLLMLMLVAFVPFTANLLAHYPTSRVAVVTFGIHVTAITVVHGSLTLYLSFHPWLLHEGMTDSYRKRSRFPAFTLAIGYAVSTLIGLAWPPAGLIAYLLVPVPYVSGLFYRWLTHLAQSPADEEEAAT
ncbi:TMEM175 family protein [Gryllotalpicola protaetiae]|nr:TMEM175 family protein [Gryllotalpicola protaetiae]